MKKVLVIAPHADDEVLGVGGTIKNHFLHGDNVYICIVTSAYEPEWSEEFIKSRKKEISKCHAYLGIKKTFEFGFPAAKLDQIPQMTINNKLQEVISLVKPQIVYIPFYGDLHKDHRIVFESSLVALRPAVYPIERILAYETVSETEWGSHLALFLPTVYSNISSTLKTKMKAMKIYGSELKAFPHPRSLKGIDYLAKKRGSEVCVSAAEAFQLIREHNI